MDKKSVLLTTIGNNTKEKRRCQVIKLFTMVLTLFYTISCNSNQYFFDEKRQQIVSLSSDYKGKLHAVPIDKSI